MSCNESHMKHTIIMNIFQSKLCNALHKWNQLHYSGISPMSGMWALGHARMILSTTPSQSKLYSNFPAMHVIVHQRHAPSQTRANSKRRNTVFSLSTLYRWLGASTEICFAFYVDSVYLLHCTLVSRRNYAQRCIRDFPKWVRMTIYHLYEQMMWR